MNPELNTWIQVLLRWAHVVAGIAWIGHLYFFNWVNAHVMKVAAYEGSMKRVVVPELMPRALFWFRWGAAWTWITGILLGGLIYYHGRIVFEDPNAGNPWLWLAIVLVVLVVGFLIYNAMAKAIKNPIALGVAAMVLFAAAYFLFEFVGKFGGRSLYIHAGVMLGTTMALNVWMVIWPAQKRIITALKGGSPLPVDHQDVVQATLRSRHNTYMSVPLVFTMISNHYFEMFGNTNLFLGIPIRDWCLFGLIALGFLAVRMLYAKSAKVTGM